MMLSYAMNASTVRLVTLTVATVPVASQDINLRAKIARNVLHSLFHNLGTQPVKVVMRPASPVPPQVESVHLVPIRQSSIQVAAPAYLTNLNAITMILMVAPPAALVISY